MHRALRSPVRAALAATLALGAVALAAAPAAAQSEAERIDALVSKYHEMRLFNGAVLVAEDGRAIYKRGYGDAVMEFDVPNTAATKFRIGSVTKQFTAAIVLQLVEEGAIDLQAPITAYLPDYPAAQGERVTIHQLLTHTSGIPSYTALPGFMDGPVRDPFEPADSLLSLVSSLALEFEPGSRWSYNNSGYHILGVIIEEVTGKPYDRVLRERILDPLGLDDTGYDHHDDVIEMRALGYERTPGGYAHASYLDTSIPFAEGMMYSTVEDLLKWDQALYGAGPFRDPATKELYFAPHAEIAGPNGPNYAYGWFLRPVAAGPDTVQVVEHGGGIFGFTTGFWRIPEERRTVIAMDNTTGEHLDEMMTDIVAILHGQDPAAPRQPISEHMAGIIEAEDVEAAVAAYRALRDSAASAYDFGESELNELGYVYLRQGDLAVATRLFELNVEQYPDASNPYDSLGEAYLEAGDRERAIVNYEKSLELNPGNDNARRILAERLGVEAEETAVEVPEASLASYVGRYELHPGFVIEITREGSALYAQATGQNRLELVPLSDAEFAVRGVDARVEFPGDAGDAAPSLVLHQGGRDATAPRIE
jgi:CubicO group peptidase (beta-lactamase class C family)